MIRNWPNVMTLFVAAVALVSVTSCVTPELQNRDVLGHRAMELSRTDGPVVSPSRSSGRAVGEAGSGGGCSICAH